MVEQSESRESADNYQQECTVLRVRHFNDACEISIQNPAYDIMCHREVQFVRVSVIKYTWFIPCLYHFYTMPIPISSSVSPTGRSQEWIGPVSLDPELLKPYRVSAVATDVIKR